MSASCLSEWPAVRSRPAEQHIPTPIARKRFAWLTLAGNLLSHGLILMGWSSMSGTQFESRWRRGRARAQLASVEDMHTAAARESTIGFPAYGTEFLIHRCRRA